MKQQSHKTIKNYKLFHQGKTKQNKKKSNKTIKNDKLFVTEG